MMHAPMMRRLMLAGAIVGAIDGIVWVGVMVTLKLVALLRLLPPAWSRTIIVGAVIWLMALIVTMLWAHAHRTARGQ